MITRNVKFMDDRAFGFLLRSVAEEHLAKAPRMTRLKNAYDNKRDILSRERLRGQPNNKLAHGYARYITTMAAGYLIGKPIIYHAKNGQEEALKAVTEAYAQTDIESEDAELAKQASIYGRAVELVFTDGRARPRAVSLDPREAFVVYDDGVTSEPLFGVLITKNTDCTGKTEEYAVTVYTQDNAFIYRVKEIEELQKAVPAETKRHYFGAVPMVEFWNGEDETGDFEQVESLIDAYDKLESDRVNDKEQFVDALLVITGAAMETDERGRTPGQQLRQDKVLALPDPECRAEFLSHALTEADAEVLKNALKADIHKFSMVPDLTDEQFAGNASGVAMKYKLLGLEQLMRIKERWFKQGLRERMRLFAEFLAVKGAPKLDADSVVMTLTRSLPVNELEIAQTVQAYKGLVPDELLLGQVPFVSDAADALAKLNEHKSTELQRQREAFSGISDADKANAEG